jgi:hypothetical protein
MSRTIALPSLLRLLTVATLPPTTVPTACAAQWLFMPGLISYFSPPELAAERTQYMVGLVSVYSIVLLLVVLTVPFLMPRRPVRLMLPRRGRAASEGGSEQPVGLEGSEAAAEAPGRNKPDRNSGGVELIIAAGASSPTAATGSSRRRGGDVSAVSDLLGSGSAPPPTADARVLPAPPLASIPSILLTKPPVQPLSAAELADAITLPSAAPVSPEPRCQVVARPSPVLPPSSDAAAISRTNSSSHLLTSLGSFTARPGSSRQVLSGLRRSSSAVMQRVGTLVELVWTFPTGWTQPQPQPRQEGQFTGAAASANSLCCAGVAG